MPAPYTLELHPVVGIVNEITTTPSETLVLTLLPVLQGASAPNYTAGEGIVITGLNLAVDTTVIATRGYTESVSGSTLIAANTFSDIANAATLASANATTALVQDLAETNAFKINQLQNDLNTTDATAASNYSALDTAKADKTTVTTLQTLVDTKATPADITAAIAVLVDGAPDALNTLSEIATALQGDEATIATILTALNNRVRFDAAQSLTTPQQDQARSNINAEKVGVAATLVAAVTPASIGAATAAQGAKADSALQSGDLAPVALSGSFSDLINKSALFNLAYSAYAIGSNVAIAATDTLGQMLGNLQAQVSAKLDANANAVSATKLATARTINGASFDGTSNITIVDSTKEPAITATTSADYYRGDKTFVSFATTVRATVLTGLSTATGTVITATDTVLSALGSLQNQITNKTVDTLNNVVITSKATNDLLQWNGTAWVNKAFPAAGIVGNSLMRPSQSISSASGVVTINLANPYEVYLLTLTENVTSWSFTNLPAAGFVAEIRIKLTQGASTAYTCVSPATSGSTAGGAWVNSSALGAIESLGIAIDSSGNKTLFPSGVYA